MIFDINAQIKKIKDMMIEKTSNKDFPFAIVMSI